MMASVVSRCVSLGPGSAVAVWRSGRCWFLARRVDACAPFQGSRVVYLSQGFDPGLLPKCAQDERCCHHGYCCECSLQVSPRSSSRQVSLLFPKSLARAISGQCLSAARTPCQNRAEASGSCPIAWTNRCGPRATSVVGALIMITGCTLMALADKNDQTLLMLGYFFLGTAGPFLQVPHPSGCPGGICGTCTLAARTSWSNAPAGAVE